MKPSPWASTLPSHVVVGVATLGPVSRWTRAPGTLGSVAGLIWFTLFFYPLSMISYFLLLAVSIYLAVHVCGEAEVRMQKIDPPEVILDEFVAVPICFIGLQPALWQGPAWLVLLAGFLLFRFFDIVKPFGIRRLQNMQGGLGVVLDDVAAAVVTCLSLHALALLGVF